MEHALGKWLLEWRRRLIRKALIEDIEGVKTVIIQGKYTINGKTFQKCIDCPYFGDDGCGPGPVMVCSHPKQDGDLGRGIIHRPDCDEGFPPRCPLVRIEAEM